jgi:hypothetical protein
MNFTKLTLTAAVFTAFSMPAVAQTIDFSSNKATINNSTSIVNDIDVAGAVAVTGNINIAAEGSSVVNNVQTSFANSAVVVGGSNVASITDHTGDGATGNISINIASGAANAQGNEGAVSALGDASQVFASAQTFSTQTSAVNFNLGLATENVARLDHSLSSVKGNVGVNIASGAANLQSNQLAATSAKDGDMVAAKATGSNDQLISNNFSLDITDSAMVNKASISDSLRHSTGNMSINVASGAGNLQHNSMSIAAVR